MRPPVEAQATCVAMGIGYALLENLPLEAGGAGDGRWNLDRYHVALSADVPLARLNLTTLPSDEPTAKGIAEAVPSRAVAGPYPSERHRALLCRSGWAAPTRRSASGAPPSRRGRRR